MYKGLAVGKKVAIVYSDFEKAFEKVNHGVLLSKFFHIGVRGKLLKLIESYLKDRSFRVRVGECLSSPRSVTSGVPQGSLLSPLLFLVLINDFPDSCEFTTCYLCADDAKIVYIGDSPSLMEQDLDNIALWCYENVMSVNASKCNHLSLAKSCRYSISNEALTVVTQQKYLGIIMEDSLKWSSHKAMTVLMMLKRNSRSTAIECRKNLYKTMVLTYGSPCWSPNVDSLKRLEKVQKYATTWMVGSNDYKANLLETNLLPISLYLQLTDLLVLSRFIQAYYDFENRNFVEFHSPNRQTRYSQYTHFVVPLITKSLCESNFWVCCPKLVNRLPTTP